MASSTTSLLLNLATSAGAFCSQVDAAVAYAESKDHPLLQTCKQRNLRLTFYGLLDEDGAVGFGLLKELLSWGPSRAEARLVKGNFHPKVIWWRGYGAYVGSANLTHKAWYNNVEAGVFLDEGELLSTGAAPSSTKEMFDHLANNSNPCHDRGGGEARKLSSRRLLIAPPQAKIKVKFNQLFGHLPDNQGLTVTPPKDQKVNKALQRFATEWMQILQSCEDSRRSSRRSGSTTHLGSCRRSPGSPFRPVPTRLLL